MCFDILLLLFYIIKYNALLLLLSVLSLACAHCIMTVNHGIGVISLDINL